MQRCRCRVCNIFHEALVGSAAVLFVNRAGFKQSDLVIIVQLRTLTPVSFANSLM